ncbi:glycosyltransferase [Polynucleobacter paneuropaeus]|nr:glycosyltransferase [Polynucleobacter paneuropaeus]
MEKNQFDREGISFPGGFTVLMALYGGDQAKLFEAAVHSVFANTILPDQFLIVVDGPIPTLLKTAIENLQIPYPLIEFIYMPENKGLANALNMGLTCAKFEWIVRADADDINLPERFYTLAKACLDHPNIQLVGSSILEVDEQGHALAIRELPSTEEAIRQFAKMRNPFNHMTVAYRLEAALACGGYPHIFLKEDYGLWCYFLAKGYQVMNINTILVHASAGMSMFRRRGGWRYAKSEWQMQKLLVQCDLKNSWRAFLDGVLRAGFFLIPPYVRGFIYLHFLRKSV